MGGREVPDSSFFKNSRADFIVAIRSTALADGAGAADAAGASTEGAEEATVGAATEATAGATPVASSARATISSRCRRGAVAPTIVSSVPLTTSAMRES